MWKTQLFAKDSNSEVLDRLILFLNENKIKKFKIVYSDNVEHRLEIIYIKEEKK